MTVQNYKLKENNFTDKRSNVKISPNDKINCFTKLIF